MRPNAPGQHYLDSPLWLVKTLTGDMAKLHAQHLSPQMAA